MTCSTSGDSGNAGGFSSSSPSSSGTIGCGISRKNRASGVGRSAGGISLTLDGSFEPEGRGGRLLPAEAMTRVGEQVGHAPERRYTGLRGLMMFDNRGENGDDGGKDGDVDGGGEDGDVNRDRLTLKGLACLGLRRS